MLTDFKQFLLRGNVVDLAVGIVIGAAFGAVVDALVADFITPVIAAIFGEPDFSALTFEINESVFRYGHFINVLLTFVLVAAAVFFLVVKPVNGLIADLGGSRLLTRQRRNALSALAKYLSMRDAVHSVHLTSPYQRSSVKQVPPAVSGWS